ncbi:cytochrome P450 [Streptomyces xanthophaeus]|uniref:cytochrome P450 n=1 Tax=Streptomyces xanthophaeus TaxID=67385 RepID=UPI00233F2C41|nr:cytochrome P450 [Streptomyces xanthophaeus]WCD85213.1 Biotin biosynthesis cytochrome P450 [Streptomyces xanthophaeus]
MTTSLSPDLARLADPAVRPDPYEVLRALREASPYADPASGIVVVGRRADCESVLRSPKVSSDRRGAGVTKVPQMPNLMNLDAPDHTRLRKLAGKAFKPRLIEQWRPRIEEIVQELLAEIAAGGDSADIVSAFAYPLPVRVICEMLGVPREDHPVFETWARSIAYTVDPQLVPGELSTEVAAEVEEARTGFIGYFRRLIAERKADPRDDVLSELIAAEEAGDQLTETELIITCVLLLVAGHETTANLILNGILGLLRHPEQLRLLRERPELAGAAVEEVLRYDAPAQMITRIAREPFTLGELEVTPGTPLLVLLAAANRDPQVHRDPDTFDITRGDPGHLGFAAGPHFCLGSVLARLEGGIALNAFAQAFVEPRLDTAGLRYRPHVSVRGPDRMPVSFEEIRLGAVPAAGSGQGTGAGR